MAFAKLLALVTAALVSAAPAPNHSTDSTGTQGSTVKAVTNHTEHSMRSLGDAFQYVSRNCRTCSGPTTDLFCTGVKTTASGSNFDWTRKECEDRCAVMNACVGYEYTPAGFFYNGACELHTQGPLVPNGSPNIQGAECWKKDENVFHTCVRQRRDHRDDPDLTFTEMVCDFYLKGQPRTFNGYACRTLDFQEQLGDGFTWLAITQGECGNHCNDEPRCKGYSFSPSKKECRLGFQEVRFMEVAPEPDTVCVINTKQEVCEPDFWCD